MLKIFAVTAPGLGPYAAAEICRLGLGEQRLLPDSETGTVSPLSDEAGGVEFDGDLPDVYRANLWLRSASRVLVRLSSFYATSFEQLRLLASRLPWQRYLRPGQPVALRVTCHRSRLYVDDAVERHLLLAIADRLGAPVTAARHEMLEGRLPQLIVVRLFNNRCTISIDASGELLHRRGYRLASARAPLRETLAAGILFAAGWQPPAPLLDPMCGSGTLPIEAALLAAGLAPGRERRFAFMDWPDFDPLAWQRLLDAARAIPTPASLPPILASDRDAGAIELARANAARAGVAGLIQFDCRPISAIQPPPGPGWVVTNPPYGVRVSAGHDLRNLYAQLGNVLRAHCPGWQAAILCNDDRLISFTHLPFGKGVSLSNGGIPVKLSRGKIPT